MSMSSWRAAQEPGFFGYPDDEPRADDRLRCCVCGADLGPADDPYRDPDCMDCLKREWEQEAQAAEDEDRRRGEAEWAPDGIYGEREPMTEQEMEQDSDARNFIDLPF